VPTAVGPRPTLAEQKLLEKKRIQEAKQKREEEAIKVVPPRTLHPHARAGV
jgi:hypothetical protein